MSHDLPALVPSSNETSAETSLARPVGAVDSGVPVESSPATSPSVRKTVSRRIGRVRPPKDSKVYKVVQAVIALRAQGVKAKEISETLGYSEDTLRQYISRANKKGWINISSFQDVDDQLEYVLKHKVVKNINQFLNDQDKDVTLEAAKGLGLFKTHQVVKGDTTNAIGVALSVSVQMPPDAKQNSKVTVRPGTIDGAFALDVPIDAEIVNEET